MSGGLLVERHNPERRPQAAEFCFGDDIPALIADACGGIWTADGNEGIYSHHLACVAGLAGWNVQGRPVWAPEGRLPDDPLAGCTAAAENESNRASMARPPLQRA